MFASCRIFTLVFCSFLSLTRAGDQDSVLQDEANKPARGTMLFQSGQAFHLPVLGWQSANFDTFADLTDEFEGKDVSAAAAKVPSTEVADDISEILMGPKLAKSNVQTLPWTYLSYSNVCSLFQDALFLIFGIVGYYVWRGCPVRYLNRLPSRTRPSCSGAGAAHGADAIKPDIDQLVQAMYADSKEQLQKLLQERSTDVAGEVCGCTALHAAAHCNCAQEAQALLLHGASSNMKDTWDETPLHVAARSGSVQVCELLLAYGSDVNARNVWDWTPLLVAADAGKEEVCKLLLSRGAGCAGLSDVDLPPLLSALLVQNMFDISGTKLKHA